MPSSAKIASLPNLTKREVVLKLSEKHPHLVQHHIVGVLDDTLSIIQESLASGRNAEFRNFGVLQVVYRKARPGRNPNKPEETVRIPARASVRFKVGKVLKQQLAALRSE